MVGTYARHRNGDTRTACRDDVFLQRQEDASNRLLHIIHHRHLLGSDRHSRIRHRQPWHELLLHNGTRVHGSGPEAQERMEKEPSDLEPAQQGRAEIQDGHPDSARRAAPGRTCSILPCKGAGLRKLLLVQLKSLDQTGLHLHP